jgi:chorismate mutase
MAKERSVSRLDELRQQIDDIDERLVQLLSARAACALEIGHEKKLLGLEVGHVQRINKGPLDNEAMKRLFERIIDEARRLERIADEEAEAEQEAQQDDSLT